MALRKIRLYVLPNYNSQILRINFDDYSQKTIFVAN